MIIISLKTLIILTIIIITLINYPVTVMISLIFTGAIIDTSAVDWTDITIL